MGWPDRDNCICMPGWSRFVAGGLMFVQNHWRKKMPSWNKSSRESVYSMNSRRTGQCCCGSKVFDLLIRFSILYCFLLLNIATSCSLYCFVGKFIKLQSSVFFFLSNVLMSSHRNHQSNSTLANKRKNQSKIFALHTWLNSAFVSYVCLLKPRTMHTKCKSIRTK